MSAEDRIKNTAQDVTGKIKEGVGKVTGKEHLEHEGQADQDKAELKDRGEDLKDAAGDVKRAVDPRD